MKKTLLLIGLAASLVMTGCASHKPLTEKDGYYKDYTAITNYERIVLNDSRITVRVDGDTEMLDTSLIEKRLANYLSKKGISVEFSDSAQYVVTIHKMERSDKKTLAGFNPVPSGLANSAQKVTGSSGAGAAGLGVGLLVGALVEKRLWEIDFSIFNNGTEHTRYYRLAPAAVDKQGLNGITAIATSEFFELKK